jgi:hypothetical protein
LEFPFDHQRAGEVIECPYCDRYNTMPMTDPDGMPETLVGGGVEHQTNGAVDHQANGAVSGPVHVAALNGSALAASLQLPCPSCKRELKLYFFDRLDPLCPYCSESLIDVELPTARQIAAATDSTASAEAIGAIFERLAAQKQQQTAALPRVVAEWMVSEFDRRERRLTLQQALANIRKKFGEEFVHRNKFGDLAVVDVVLEEFRKLTTDCVVWDKDGKFWRERRPGEKSTPIVRASDRPSTRGRRRKS